MKKLLFGLLGLGVLFSACNKDDLSSLSIVIEGTIYDAETETVLEGATIEITSQEKTYTATTDANGFFSMESLPTGDYTVYVTISGYLNSMSTVSSSDLTVNEATEKVIVNKSFYLPPLSESFTFTAYKSYGSYSTAAANQSYTITFSTPGNDPITGTTDEYGLVELTSMPYKSYIYVTFNFEYEGITYKETQSFYTGSPSNTFYINGYISDGDLGLVSSNILDSKGNAVDDFVVSDDVTFNFTQPIDTADAYIVFGSSVSYTENWSNNNMTLSLHPTTDLSNNTQYYIYLSLENEENTQSFYMGYVYFYTEE